MIIVSLSNNYYVEGVVTEITNVGSGIFIIKDEAGDSILIRLPKDAEGTAYASWTTRVAVGDTVQVYGKPAKNSSTPTTEKAKIEGGILTILNHEHKFNGPTCYDAAVCDCLAVGDPALGHIDENKDDACDRCSWNMKLGEASIKVCTDTTKSNGVVENGDDGKAVSWTWSDENFDVIIAKGTATVTLYTTAKDYMQLKKQNTLTVNSKNELKMVSITIFVTSESYLTQLKNAIASQYEYTEDPSTLSVTINLESVATFELVNQGTSTVYVSGVKVAYEKPVVEPEEPETPVEPEEPAGEEITIYYYNSANWSKINIWAWNAANINF